MIVALTYLAISAMVATLVVVVFEMAFKAKQKKAEALAATGLSQTGQEGTVAAGDPATNPATNPFVKQFLDEAPEAAAHLKSVAEGHKRNKFPGNQCGLEDDAEKWEEWEGPQRIKECQLSAADQAMCRRMLALIFHEDTVLGIKMQPDPQDVLDIADLVIPYLESEPVLIEDLPYPISIIGDLHGQLYDLERIFAFKEQDGKPGWECAKFLFLGDFVDRGRQSLEVTMCLFCLKVLHPDRIFILRGNHEYLTTNRTYGFWDDLEDRYEEDTARALYIKLNTAFTFLSVAAIVGGDRYLCVHGGISTTGFTRHQMRGIYKPIIHSTDEATIHDMNWSDPATGLRGTCFNGKRGSSSYFGYDALCTALASMGVKCLIRGHQMMMDGFSVKWYVCHTVFSATNYGGSKNNGGICEIDEDGRCSYNVLEWCPKRAEWEAEIRLLENGNEVDPNELTVYNHRYDDKGKGGVVDISDK